MSDMRIVACVLVAFAACSSMEGGNTSDAEAVTRQEYAPCNGEPAACPIASRFGGISGEGCLCTYYCKVDKDCPIPSTGTATPVCQPYGDFRINDHTADCRLPCDAGALCPDGMFCSVSGCIGALRK
jgi:hypothetical protein